MKNHLNAFVFAAALTGALSSSAQAGTPLTVEMDQSQLITVNSDAGSIVVGNPSIADASLNGHQVFIHGHSFGETNLMIFDTAGNKLVDFDVTVNHNTSNQLTVFLGSGTAGPSRYTYSCAPNCEANMMVGDNVDFTKNVIELSRGKYYFATGQKAADAKAPAAPQ